MKWPKILGSRKKTIPFFEHTFLELLHFSKTHNHWSRMIQYVSLFRQLDKAYISKTNIIKKTNNIYQSLTFRGLNTKQQYMVLILDSLSTLGLE